jgi:hypothetical protein
MLPQNSFFWLPLSQQVDKPVNLHACATDYHLSEWFDL